jgi:hypothetical protein
MSDHRHNARVLIEAILSQLRSHPQQSAVGPLVDECESLVRAINAFHMEGIRFRMFNVDRLLTRGDLGLAPQVTAQFAEARRELEAAGFHTRSHQAPG